jgi:glycosyltransferase involved in cell wall biosynthesis
MAHHPRAPHTAFDIVCPSKVLPMEKPPSLSVVLSTRNHMKFLPECLQGILTQTFTDFEFLIVDDGSTDDTWACLKTYAQKDPRIRLFRNEHPLGVIKSYNHLFCLAKGNHIWSVATDDHCINRDFLNDGFKLLHRFPHAAGFYANMRIVKMPGEVFERNWMTKSRDRFFKPNEIMSLFWKDSGYPSGPSLVLKKNWHTLFNGWNYDLGPQCDYFLNILAGGTSGMVYLHRESVIHRIWDAGDSFLASQNRQNLLENLGRVERLLRANLPSSMDQPEQWNRWRIGAILRATNFEHQLKNYFSRKGTPPPMIFFSLLRGLIRAVEAFCSGWQAGDSPRLSGAKANPKIFVIRMTRDIWNDAMHSYTWRVVFRFWKSLRKRAPWTQSNYT